MANAEPSQTEPSPTDRPILPVEERRSIVQRSQPALGAATLALTTGTWIGRTIEGDGLSIDRTYSFWGLFESARDGLQGPLALGAGLIILFVAVSIFGRHTSAVPAASTGWVAALVTTIIITQTDGGYSPGPGAWLTLGVTVVAAVVATVESVVASRDR